MLNVLLIRKKSKENVILKAANTSQKCVLDQLCSAKKLVTTWWINSVAEDHKKVEVVLTFIRSYDTERPNKEEEGKREC